jgi:hypothetical protein
VYGMQDVTAVTGSGLIGYPKLWLKRRLGEAVFVPVGISGSYRLYPPDPGRSEIPPAVLAVIAGNKPAEPIVTVSLGRPFTYTRLRDELADEPDNKQKKHLDLMMRKIANLLPVTERGAYGPVTSL